ncbi:NAD(P)H-nitrite reductase [Mizugakiibacter sediminis]|uniref:FAD-dependent pyridine nucleotide-disulfide oxidoreductase n=1 Tax=Mizugakiibacter sediminis TaxID=1475481 RepID=A0A0K8QNQ7_9GAMM|nr:FAD-dependent oxidoreductase [Mizugakiibacter sediminis]GAP66052.1 NAD(P)H-nitrite reductase [Mizugakiibacter sediminis]
MQHDYDYLIVGAGMAGEAAAQALRSVDADARIGLIGAEPYPPYDRPPLSKALWKDAQEDSVWRPVAKARALLHLGRRAVALDRAAHTVADDAGDVYRYRKLLLATGGTPRRLAFGGDAVIHYRTLDDYRRLRAAVTPGARAAVVGGGFIGSEIAAALALNGCRVTMLFPEDAIGARVYPPALARFVTDYYRGRGVDVRCGVTAVDGAARDGGFELALSDGTALRADIVVAGLGIAPNVELAARAGLAVDDGIVVDAHLRTSDPDIYAAGDVAAFPAPALGRRLRVEHENAAIAQGHRAGLGMAGQDAPYDELPFFYSDLFDLGYEAVGTLDARLETVEQWAQPFREGVVYYLDAGRVRGVLLWNTWGQVESARALIAAPGPFDAESVRGRLPA